MIRAIITAADMAITAVADMAIIIGQVIAIRIDTVMVTLIDMFIGIHIALVTIAVRIDHVSGRRFARPFEAAGGTPLPAGEANFLTP